MLKFIIILISLGFGMAAIYAANDLYIYVNGEKTFNYSMAIYSIIRLLEYFFLYVITCVIASCIGGMFKGN